MSVALPIPLRSAEELVHRELESAFGQLHPDLRVVAEYHRGWVDADGAPDGHGGGKCLRAALAMVSGEQCGDEAAGVTAAAAVEMVHDFSLLHDDIMDGDETRRHRPTAWTVFGTGRAILAGDALLVLAHRHLLASGRPRAAEASARLLDTAHDLIDGQARDLALEGSMTPSLPDCILMSGRKTGALLSAAASLGALLAGAPPRVTEALADYGMHLGLAFQAVDDILGIWGDEDVTGKPAAGDLARGKRSLPVVFALDTAGRAHLLDGLTVRLAGDAELIDHAGGRSLTEQFARDQLDRAVAALDSAPLEASVRAQLQELGDFVVRREL